MVPPVGHVPVSDFPEVVDSTLLASARACGQKANLAYFEHFKPTAISVHLHAGKAYADGLERARRSFWEGGFSAPDSIAHGAHALIESYGDYIPPDDSAKRLDRMLGALEFHFERYPLGADGTEPILMPGGKRAIEFSGASPLPIAHPTTGNPILYSWRADTIDHFADGVWVHDDKTSTSLGSYWSTQWDLRCFSEDHELFTREGWRQIRDINPDAEVLQSDEDGNLSFTRPIELIKTQLEGDLLSLEGRRVSQLVTQNHRVLLNKRRGGHLTVPADALYKQDQQHMLPLAGRHTEERLPEAVQRFVAAVQADAKLQNSRGKVTSGQGHREHMPNRAIILGFTKGRKIERMKALLEELSVNYKTNSDGFYISGFDPITELVDRLLDDNKNFIPGHETLYGDAFLNELEHWDGWKSQYYTNSANNARFVCTVAALNDRAASASCDSEGHWTVVLSQDTQRSLDRIKVEPRPYNGQVYCVTVPLGYVLTRRKGMISLSGNSQFTAYCWGAASQGVKVTGVLVRGVSILKTKYDTLQHTTYRPQWMIDRWLAQTVRDIGRLIEQWKTGVWNFNLDDACTAYGGCQFRQVCMSEDPKPWLEMSFTRRRWDPLTRTETAL